MHKHADNAFIKSITLNAVFSYKSVFDATNRHQGQNAEIVITNTKDFMIRN